MNNTALAWVGCYVLLAVLSFRRPAWGIGMYLLTFYLSPSFWWWGAPLMAISTRINLASALILAVVVFGQYHKSLPLSSRDRTVFTLLLIYAINATAVHWLFANNPERSLNGMTMIWKQVGLLFLFTQAMRNRSDINIFIGAILMGSLYIAYEVVVNDRGGIEAGRLEGVGAPGAAESNYLAGLMAFAIPLGGYWLFYGSKWQKGLSFVTLVLVFEVIIRCNSRGVFLALIAAGVWLFLSAKGRVRKQAFIGIALGCLAAYCMIGNAKITERFMTTFAPAEERDASAQSRMDYWGAARNMIADYPLGSGAEAAFKSELGIRYLSETGITVARAVHNGYLDIAASWGVQGLTLYLGVIAIIWRRVRRVRVAAARRDDEKASFLGTCLESALITQLVSCMFISSLDGEWFFWWFAVCLSYERLYGFAPVEESTGESISDQFDRQSESADLIGQFRRDPLVTGN